MRPVELSSQPTLSLSEKTSKSAIQNAVPLGDFWFNTCARPQDGMSKYLMIGEQERKYNQANYEIYSSEREYVSNLEKIVEVTKEK